jgi:lipopolysaccharide/colanic/teichoic acid biosynthesis glycosyltransferase
MGSATRGWAGRRRRLGTAVLATLVVAALVTTVSRAALAALPLAGLVIAAVLPAAGHHSLRLRRLARTAFGGLVALLVVWLGARAVVEPRPTPLPGSAWQAVRQTLDPRTPIADVLKSRHLMWQAAGRMFVEAPALGVGLGQFPRLYARDTSGQRAENAHNFYLQTLAEGGLAGLLGLTLLVGSAWLALRPHLVGARRRPRALAAGFAVGLLAWLLTSVSGHPALTVSNQVWLGALLALAVTSVQPGSPDRRRNSAGRASAPRPASLRLKRAVDVTAALALLALLLPLMVFIAAIIRLDSRGPALFRHRRVTTRGANGRSNTTDRVEPRMFDFIKFRTMFDDVDPYEPSPTSPADPRVTRVGRLLRRTCLDELPQLWNVLKGDLSLVGPRPEMPWVVARYDASARRRFGAQPGVTGLWQLRGHRDRHIHDDIRWDLWYIRRRSLRLDMVILCETLFFVVGRRNH